MPDTAFYVYDLKIHCHSLRQMLLLSSLPNKADEAWRVSHWPTLIQPEKEELRLPQVPLAAGSHLTASGLRDFFY